MSIADSAVLIGIAVIRIFAFGIILGVAAALAALHFIPLVDQYREESIISVSTNGGNTETFHVKVPTDRIMIGAQGYASPLPAGMDWPDDPRFRQVRAELFKLRNSRDAVIGVASRFTSEAPEFGNVIEWVLHLPARGTVFARIQPQSGDGGRRLGDLHAGTREFGNLSGRISERWVAGTSASDQTPSGRIELLMTFVGNEFYIPEEELAE